MWEGNASEVEGADLSSSGSLGRAPTTEEDKKAAEKKREDKAKKKHDRKSRRPDVRGGVPLVKVRLLELK